MEVFGEALNFGVTDVATLWRWKLALPTRVSAVHFQEPHLTVSSETTNALTYIEKTEQIK
jgi:hypothetical protein